MKKQNSAPRLSLYIRFLIYIAVKSNIGNFRDRIAIRMADLNTIVWKITTADSQEIRNKWIDELEGKFPIYFLWDFQKEHPELIDHPFIEEITNEYLKQRMLKYIKKYLKNLIVSDISLRYTMFINDLTRFLYKKVYRFKRRKIFPFAIKFVVFLLKMKGKKRIYISKSPYSESTYISYCNSTGFQKKIRVSMHFNPKSNADRYIYI